MSLQANLIEDKSHKTKALVVVIIIRPTWITPVCLSVCLDV